MVLRRALKNQLAAFNIPQLLHVAGASLLEKSW
jgi:hypothetical protein